MRTLLAASTGKDSVWAIHVLREQGHEVVAMLTTFGEVSGRVPFQMASRALIEAQAQALGLTPMLVPLPTPCSQVQYESALNLAAEEARRDWEIEAVAFADVYREDMRIYRTKLFEQMDLAVLFPLWGSDTRALAQRMIAAGLKALITSIRKDRLAPSFLGREFDAAFLADLPPAVDPCGELGGFRTFAYDGPMFRHPVPVRRGAVLDEGDHLQLELELAV